MGNLSKRKKNHNDRILPEQWTFGGICKESKVIYPKQQIIPGQASAECSNMTIFRSNDPTP